MLINAYLKPNWLCKSYANYHHHILALLTEYQTLNHSHSLWGWEHAFSLSILRRKHRSTSQLSFKFQHLLIFINTLIIKGKRKNYTSSKGKSQGAPKRKTINIEMQVILILKAINMFKAMVLMSLKDNKMETTQGLMVKYMFPANKIIHYHNNQKQPPPTTNIRQPDNLLSSTGGQQPPSCVVT